MDKVQGLIMVPWGQAVADFVVLCLGLSRGVELDKVMASKTGIFSCCSL